MGQFSAMAARSRRSSAGMTRSASGDENEGGRSSNTDYLAIMVTMTTTNLIIMIMVTLAIMTTAIMVTMTIVDCITLAIMVTLMKNTYSKSCIKDNFAEIQLWQPNVQECIIYHREYILH